jgi:transcriptional regulator with XRE-family HTH domain
MPKRIIPQLPTDISQKMKEIGSRVSDCRQKVGSNYKKFAKDHGINNMTLWRIEKGEDYKMSSLLQVLNAIGISLEDLLK